MALSANALTTTANALAWLRRPSSGVTLAADTALLELCINGVSEAIIRYTERQFIAEAGVTKTFEYRSGAQGYLDISPYELRNIASVTLAGAALVASTGSGDGDYVAQPRNATREGTFTSLDMRGYYRLNPSFFIYSTMLQTRDVVIVGDWGMAAIPADVSLACLIAVSDLYRNPEQVSGRGSGDFQFTEVSNPGSDESLPPGARRLLDPFVRPKVI